jgi:hypothetical protein
MSLISFSLVGLLSLGVYLPRPSFQSTADTPPPLPRSTVILSIANGEVFDGVVRHSCKFPSPNSVTDIRIVPSGSYRSC